MITDPASGSQPNFSYEHQIEIPESARLLSGRVDLTHSGNSNLGPVQEIWKLYSGSLLLGILGTSDRNTLMEGWELPGSLISSLSNNQGLLPLSLIEDTAFNSERLDLHSSALSVNYELPRPAQKQPPAPAVPEPGSFGLLAAALLSRAVFRKAAAKEGKD